MSLSLPLSLSLSHTSEVTLVIMNTLIVVLTRARLQVSRAFSMSTDSSQQSKRQGDRTEPRVVAICYIHHFRGRPSSTGAGTSKKLGVSSLPTYLHLPAFPSLCSRSPSLPPFLSTPFLIRPLSIPLPLSKPLDVSREGLKFHT